MIGKWLAAGSKLFIFDEPTRGIDIGAKSEIFALIDRLVAEGAAALMISSEQVEIVPCLRPRLCDARGPHRRAPRAQRADRGEHRATGDASCVRPRSSLNRNPLQRIPGVAIVLVLLIALFSTIAPGFLSVANLSNVLVQSTILTHAGAADDA